MQKAVALKLKQRFIIMVIALQDTELTATEYMEYAKPLQDSSHVIG